MQELNDSLSIDNAKILELEGEIEICSQAAKKEQEKYETSINKLNEELMSAQTAKASNVPSSRTSRQGSVSELSPMLEKSGALAMIEKMQREIKQHELQANAFQIQVDMLTCSRDEMADEIVKLSTQNEQLYDLFNVEC